MKTRGSLKYFFNINFSLFLIFLPKIYNQAFRNMTTPNFSRFFNYRTLEINIINYMVITIQLPLTEIVL